MKQKHLLTLYFLTLCFSFVGCSSREVSKTPDKSLRMNGITETSITKKSYFMQNLLDDWLENDWEPTVKKDEEIQKKYEDNKTKSFTLQEYVDKIGAYQKAKPNDYNTSHQHQMDALPVIGK